MLMVGLRPYQETAADFLFENDRAMILAPVGAGKTAITLTAMQAMLDGGYAKRFLVLAPKRVCTDVWPVEQKLWAHQMSLSVCVGSIKQRLASLNSSAQVVVTNYDNLQWLAKQTLDFDAVVFDELTRLKNPSGARFKALHKVLDCPIRWGLTGSFTSNGLEDVFGQCKIVDQSLLGRSKGAFQQQYFVLINKEYGEWAPRVGSLEKVMAVIKPATFVLEAGDYTLPSLNIVPVMCAMDLTHYNKMKKDFVVEFPTAKAVALNAGVVTGKLQQMASGFVYDANSSIWFSSHKFDRLDELLAENQRANTIIAYTYQEELAELKRRYPKAQTLDDTKAIERWNAGKIEMLLVHPKSAGHGLNLQHGGCNMVFLSLPWSLELYEQTIGRLHRSGQKNAVWVYVMTTLKTVDERIYAALQDKRAISDIAMEELK
jgi:SNF2 family DNA or RNA helicase